MPDSDQPNVLLLTEEGATLGSFPAMDGLNLYGGSYRAIHSLWKRLEAEGVKSRVLILTTRDGWVDAEQGTAVPAPDRSQLRSVAYSAAVQTELRAIVQAGRLMKIVLSLSEQYFRAVFRTDRDFVEAFRESDAEWFVIAGERILSGLRLAVPGQQRLHLFRRPGVARMTNEASRAILSKTVGAQSRA